VASEKKLICLFEERLFLSLIVTTPSIEVKSSIGHLVQKATLVHFFCSKKLNDKKKIETTYCQEASLPTKQQSSTAPMNHHLVTKIQRQLVVALTLMTSSKKNTKKLFQNDNASPTILLIQLFAQPSTTPTAPTSHGNILISCLFYSSPHQRPLNSLRLLPTARARRAGAVRPPAPRCCPCLASLSSPPGGTCSALASFMMTNTQIQIAITHFYRSCPTARQQYRNFLFIGAAALVVQVDQHHLRVSRSFIHFQYRTFAIAYHLVPQWPLKFPRALGPCS
jgi:hypothetical protein